MELKEVIGRRRTIRFFLPFRPVERAKIQKMLLHGSGEEKIQFNYLTGHGVSISRKHQFEGILSRYTDRDDHSHTTETGKLFAPDCIADLDTFCHQPVTKLMLLGEPRIVGGDERDQLAHRVLAANVEGVVAGRQCIDGRERDV